MKQSLVFLFLATTYTPIFSYVPPNDSDYRSEQYAQQSRNEHERDIKLQNHLNILHNDFIKKSPGVSVLELYTGNKIGDAHDKLVYLVDFLIEHGGTFTVKGASLFYKNIELIHSTDWLLNSALHQNCPHLINILLAHGVPLQPHHLNLAMCNSSYRARFENKYKTALVLCAYGVERKHTIYGKTVSQQLRHGNYGTRGQLVESGQDYSMNAPLRVKLAELIDSFDMLDQFKSLSKDLKLFFSRLPSELRNEIEKYIIQSDLPKKRTRE